MRQASVPVHRDGTLLGNVQLLGTGLSPALTVAPAAVQLGGVEPGSTVARSVTFANEGEAAAELTTLALQAPGGGPADPAFLLDAPPAPVSLSPGEQLEVTVRFAPDARRSYEAQLVYASTDPGLREGAVALRGFGGGPAIAVWPEAVAFGEVPVGATVRRTVQVVSGGALDLALQAAEVSGDGFSVEPSSAVLVPGEWHPVTVSYTPPAAGAHAGALTLVNDDPARPRLRLPLAGTGIDGAGCSARVTPEDLRFGEVRLGEERLMTFAVQAAADGGPCRVAANRPVRSDGFTEFRLRDGAVDAVVEPGGTLLVQVAFAPTGAASLRAATLDVYVSDPALQGLALPLTGFARTPLDAEPLPGVPTALDLGEVAVGCARTRQVCLDPEPFTWTPAASLVGPGDPPLLEAASTHGPCYAVRFAPALEGEVHGAIRVPGADRVPRVLPVSARGVPPGPRQETFVQGPLPQADLLFVLDNSGGMYDWQRALAGTFPVLQAVATEYGVDYRIAVVSTDTNDQGRFAPLAGSGERVVSPASADPEAAFSRNVQLGTMGSPTERGLDGAFLALLPSRLEDPLRNAGFLRDGAALGVIALSDEEDQSQYPTEVYREYLWGRKGYRRNLVSLSPWTSPADAPCMSACGSAYDAGARYVDVQRATGGAFLSICTCEVAEGLEPIYRRAMGQRDLFLLDGSPALPVAGPDGVTGTADDTLQVRVRGTDGTLRAATGWSYDPARRAVLFGSLALPEPGEQVEVTYAEACGG